LSSCLRKEDVNCDDLSGGFPLTSETPGSLSAIDEAVEVAVVEESGVLGGNCTQGDHSTV
jgi:hypothetical protein